MIKCSWHLNNVQGQNWCVTYIVCVLLVSSVNTGTTIAVLYDNPQKEHKNFHPFFNCVIIRPSTRHTPVASDLYSTHALGPRVLRRQAYSDYDADVRAKDHSRRVTEFPAWIAHTRYKLYTHLTLWRSELPSRLWYAPNGVQRISRSFVQCYFVYCMCCNWLQFNNKFSIVSYYASHFSLLGIITFLLNYFAHPNISKCLIDVSYVILMKKLNKNVPVIIGMFLYYSLFIVRAKPCKLFLVDWCILNKNSYFWKMFLKTATKCCCF